MNPYMNAHEFNEASALVAALVARGTVCVNDGEEVTLSRSTDAAAILAAMATTEADCLIWRSIEGSKIGWFFIVYGNGPDELIADCADVADCIALLDEVAP